MGPRMQKLRPKPSRDLAPGGGRVEGGRRLCRRRLVGCWGRKTREAAMRPTARCLFCLVVRLGSATNPK